MSCVALDDCKLPGEEFVASMDMTDLLDGLAITGADVKVVDVSFYVTSSVSVLNVIIESPTVRFTVTGGSPGIHNIDILATRDDGQTVGQRLAMTVS